MKVVVHNRKSKDLYPGGITLDDGATVEDLQKKIYSKNKKLYPSRQRLELPVKEVTASGKPARPVVLDPRKKVSDYLEDNGIVILKDLGPQIGYSVVFLLEYLGPLLVYPIFYLWGSFIYPAMGVADKPPSGVARDAQTLALAFWSFHYAKRLLETLFVHAFSKGTMPIRNLFKNCSYYWGFAAFVSYFVNHPRYTPMPREALIGGLVLGVLAELGNLYCHILLRKLRPAGSGSTEYVIPRGFLFEYITCANYTCEILAWLGFNIATCSFFGILFMLAGLFQMAQWAKGKHKRLIEKFNGKDGQPKYPRRWIMLPPFF